MQTNDWQRLFLHLPWGMAGAVLCIHNVAIGITATLLMIIYEGFNDWRKYDHSYKDVLGIVWGFLIASYIIWLIGLW